MDRRYTAAVAVVFLLIAIARVFYVDRTVPQGFDETAHVAAGIEWLDKHTYTLDPVHPPFAQYAIALPLYIAGERLPKFSAEDPRSTNIVDLGNAILNHHGRYLRNLYLARVGILFFLCLASAVLFLWTSRLFGSLAGCLAVGLFTTLPGILAFSSMAYNDLPVACVQFTCLWVFALWLENPTRQSSAWLGVTAGLAFATKFTSFVFLPACAAAMFLCKWWAERNQEKIATERVARRVPQLALALAIAFLVLWGTYGFSTGRVRETMGLSPATMPSFQHFPAPVRTIARKAVLSDPVIPAPELVHGLALMWAANKEGPDSYLWGSVKNGGQWYFFPVAEAFKIPLAFLILAFVGTLCVVRAALHGHWAGLAPAAAIAAVFLITMPGRYKTGTRYLLIILPMFCILAGYAGSALWHSAHRELWGRVVLIALLSWQIVATVRAQGDCVAYFNELAPRDPSRVLVGGCDLDCGQDLIRLSRELQARKVSHVTLALWTNADLSQADLPPFAVAQPSKPAAGWFAISLRALRMGDVFHKTYPRNAFDWLSQYRPVARVGKTILLYYIPDKADTGPSRETEQVSKQP